MKSSDCSGIGVYVTENNSVSICMCYLFHMMILQGNSPTNLNSMLLFMLSANTRGDKAGTKMGINIVLLFCNCKPKVGRKLSFRMQYHCLSIIGIWFTVCREGGKKALFLLFLLRLSIYLHQQYLSLLRQDCKKCRYWGDNNDQNTWTRPTDSPYLLHESNHTAAVVTKIWMCNP